jgi:hypothetical protein
MEYKHTFKRFLQRIAIDITRKLKKYFPKEKKPQIVANIGGFSMDAPFPEDIKSIYYEQFFKSLKDLTVDFACREDLAITSLKEFLEVFVQSVKREQAFHHELLSSLYH